jgi:hypothetical protein
MTRSWNAFAHLRVREAFVMHPLGPLTFMAAAWIALGGQQRTIPPRIQSTPVMGALTAAWLAVWLRRLAVSGSNLVTTE